MFHLLIPLTHSSQVCHSGVTNPKVNLSNIKNAAVFILPTSLFSCSWRWGLQETHNHFSKFIFASLDDFLWNETLVEMLIVWIPQEWSTFFELFSFFHFHTKYFNIFPGMGWCAVICEIVLYIETGFETSKHLHKFSVTLWKV